MLRTKPWPTETFLRFLVIIVSLSLWAALILSVVGLVYAIAILLTIFIIQLSLVSHIRGNAVKLSETQFPEIYQKLVYLSQRAGLRQIPEAYIVESGGALNAVATRWLSSTMIILYSDLVDACRENPKALDMILGHELGHISAGHLKATWFLLPGLAFPFLGKAYSRAREFTCDRYGRDLCGDDEAAIQGLALLAVGRSLASQVNIKEYTDQSHSLKSLSMTLGRWMSTHPPLCDRILALKPELGQISYARSNLKAISILLLMICLPMGGIILIKEPHLKTPTVQSRVR